MRQRLCVVIIYIVCYIYFLFIKSRQLVDETLKLRYKVDETLNFYTLFFRVLSL